MNRTGHAIVLGLERGWAEFLLALRSLQDQAFYMIMAAGVLIYVWLNRDARVDGTLITPTVLRRMTRRQSGSVVAAARESADTQGVR